jgi:hypothetical protein
MNLRTLGCIPWERLKTRNYFENLLEDNTKIEYK